jgi:hypothetical protein
MTREEVIIKAAVTSKIGVNIEEPLKRAYQYGFRDGARWADEHPHWISVEERLPNPGAIVLMSQGLDEAVYGYFSLDHTFRNRKGYMLANVTHWMPLPSIPKGGKQ